MLSSEASLTQQIHLGGNSSLQLQPASTTALQPIFVLLALLTFLHLLLLLIFILINREAAADWLPEADSSCSTASQRGRRTTVFGRGQVGWGGLLGHQVPRLEGQRRWEDGRGTGRRG